MLIAPLNLSRRKLSAEKQKEVKDIGWEALFKQSARDIADQDIFHAYYDEGWSKKMMNAVKSFLAPKIVETLAQVWYLAIDEAKAGK